jgi:DNA replication protein DnaC
VRDPATGKYRRTRLSVLTLGFSRKCVRLLCFQSSARIWSELHETAFRRLGGTPKGLVLDNLGEGVVKPDFYDPALNPVYRDVLAHYGACALPCRVNAPDRKGKVERGVGHAKPTPLKGQRFETLAAAQAYLGRWEERWADTRIHGTTKRQVAAMFAEEKPTLQPLPVEPFRYYHFGERRVHLDGCVEVEAAYYSAPPRWIGRTVQVQWNERIVRLLDPGNGQLLREHLRQARGIIRIHAADRSQRTPLAAEQLLARTRRAGPSIGALCQTMFSTDGQIAIRRIQGVLAMAKRYRAAAADEACRMALEMGVPRYRFVRRYLEKHGSLLKVLKQADPIICQLDLYLEVIAERTKEKRMNLIELERSLRQLRLGGMAAVLETRLRQAQVEAMPPIDLLSWLVSYELTRRSDRLLERRRKEARFRDAQRTLDDFDFAFNPKMNRSLVFDLATASFISRREDALFLCPGGTGKSHLAQAIGWAAIQQGHQVLYRETHVLLDELPEVVVDGSRRDYMERITTVPLLIIDDFGMRKLPLTAAEDLLGMVMRRYERASTLLTSNRPVEDWGRVLGDVAAVGAMLDRLLHHGQVLTCGPRSWRTKTAAVAKEKSA